MGQIALALGKKWTARQAGAGPRRVHRRAAASRAASVVGRRLRANAQRPFQTRRPPEIVGRGIPLRRPHQPRHRSAKPKPTPPRSSYHRRAEPIVAPHDVAHAGGTHPPPVATRARSVARRLRLLGARPAASAATHAGQRCASQPTASNHDADRVEVFRQIGVYHIGVSAAEQRMHRLDRPARLLFGR